MNWALEALGVEPGADERAIKRAYARLLRDNRPEDDPQAFQRLHEAYQTALHWHRHQQAFADAQEEDAGVGDAGWTFAAEDSAAHAAPASPEEQTDIAAQVIAPEIVSTPTEPVADSLGFAADDFVMPPAIDVEALVDRIIDAASHLPPDGFETWLNQCPELWSLDAKADAGNALLGRLYHGEDAVGGANFDQLTAAFGWDEVGTHVDPDTLAGMRETLHHRWIWQAGNEPALALELQVDQDAPATLPDRPTAVWLWLPLMAIAAIMLGSTQLEFLGTMLGGGALWIGVRRALRGSQRLNQALPLLAIGVFFAAPFVMQSMRLSYGALTGGLTLMLCVYELGSAYRNRRQRA